MANPANLTPFKPGNPGGPGLKKGQKIMRTLLREALEMIIERKNKDGVSVKKTGAEWVAMALMNKAMKEDVPAIKEIMDRIDGKLAQTNIIEGNEDAPLESMVTVRNEADQAILDRYFQKRLNAGKPID